MEVIVGVHRRDKMRARGRAHLQGAAGGPVHLLLGQDPPAVGPGRCETPCRRPSSSRCGSQEPRVYGVRKLWRAAQRAGNDIGRDQVARLMAAGRSWPVSAGARRSTRPAPTRLPTRAPDLVERDFTAAAPNRLVGERPHLCRHLGGCRLRLLHHRRLLPHDRRLACRRAHAHRHGPRRPRDGPVASRHPPRQA